MAETIRWNKGGTATWRGLSLYAESRDYGHGPIAAWGMRDGSASIVACGETHGMHSIKEALTVAKKLAEQVASAVIGVGRG